MESDIPRKKTEFSFAARRTCPALSIFLSRLARASQRGAHLPTVLEQPLLHRLELCHRLWSLVVLAVWRTVLFPGHHLSPPHTHTHTLSSPERERPLQYRFSLEVSLCFLRFLRSGFFGARVGARPRGDKYFSDRPIKFARPPKYTLKVGVELQQRWRLLCVLVSRELPQNWQDVTVSQLLGSA